MVIGQRLGQGKTFADPFDNIAAWISLLTPSVKVHDSYTEPIRREHATISDYCYGEVFIFPDRFQPCLRDCCQCDSRIDL